MIQDASFEIGALQKIFPKLTQLYKIRLKNTRPRILKENKKILQGKYREISNKIEAICNNSQKTASNNFDNQNREREISSLLNEMGSLVKLLIPRLDQVYWLDGMHGGVFYFLPEAIRQEFKVQDPDIGWEEMDDPDYATKKSLDFIEWAIKYRGKLTLDLGVSTLEALSFAYPNFIEKVKEYLTLEPRTIELVNGTYAQAYSIITDEEYNIRAHQIGQTMLQRLFGQKARWFVSQEFAWYPQSPQILALLGYEGCLLRCRFKNQVLPLPYDRFYWQGLDGTKIDTVPEHTGIGAGDYCNAGFYPKSVKNLAKFELHPEYRLMVYHNLEDMTDNMPLRKEFMWMNFYNPVFGRHYLYSEMFQQSPPAQGLHEVPLSTFAVPPYKCKVLYIQAKQTERLLVGFEILHTFLKTTTSLDLAHNLSFVNLWKMYLQTNNHDAYAVPEHINGDYFRARERFLGPYKGPAPKCTVNHQSLDFLKMIHSKLTGTLNQIYVPIPDGFISNDNSIGKNQQFGSIFIFNPWNWNVQTPILIRLEKFRAIMDLSLIEKEKLSFLTFDGSEIPSLYHDGFWTILPKLTPCSINIIKIQDNVHIQTQKWYQLQESKKEIRLQTSQLDLVINKQKGSIQHLDFLSKDADRSNVLIKNLQFYRKFSHIFGIRKEHYEWTIHESKLALKICQKVFEQSKNAPILIGWIEYCIFSNHSDIFITANLGKSTWNFGIHHPFHKAQITVDFPFGYSNTTKRLFQSLNYVLVRKKSHSPTSSKQNKLPIISILSCGIQQYLNVLGKIILYSFKELAKDVDSVPARFAISTSLKNECEAFQKARALQTQFDRLLLEMPESQPILSIITQNSSKTFFQWNSSELILLNYTLFDAVNLQQTDSTIFLRILNYSNQTITDHINLPTILIDEIQKIDLQNKSLESPLIQKDRHTFTACFHPFEVSTFQIKILSSNKNEN